MQQVRCCLAKTAENKRKRHDASQCATQNVGKRQKLHAFAIVQNGQMPSLRKTNKHERHHAAHAEWTDFVLGLSRARITLFSCLFGHRRYSFVVALPAACTSSSSSSQTTPRCLAPQAKSLAKKLMPLTGALYFVTGAVPKRARMKKS